MFSTVLSLLSNIIQCSTSVEHLSEGLQGVYVVRVYLHEIVHQEKEKRRAIGYASVFLAGLLDGRLSGCRHYLLRRDVRRYLFRRLKAFDQCDIFGDISL